MAQARTRFPIDERRAQLVDIGSRLFAERSYDSISIDEIAAEAGISKGLLYHYFSTKREFYVEVLRAGAATMRAAVEPDPDLPPVEQLRRSIDAHLDWVEQHAEGYITVIRGGIGSDDEVRAITEESREIAIQRVLDSLPTAHGRSKVVRLALQGWIGLLETVTIEWVQHRRVPRSEVSELLVQALWGTLWAASRVDPKAPIDGSSLD